MDMFWDDEIAYNYLLSNNVMKREVECSACKNIMLLKNNVIFIRRVFICPNRKCNNKRKLNFKSEFENVKLDFSKIIKIIYTYVYNYNIYQSLNFCQITKPTYIKIKDIITRKLIIDDEKLGGKGFQIQIDETAICNGLIIKNPSSTLDTKNNVQWIIGGVDNSSKKNFFLVLVPNRRAETIYDVFTRYIKKETVIITDGYPSYPAAVKKFGSIHKVVNHSIGFKNEEGFHTNGIENLWSHLKKTYRERAGINKKRIDLFLKEFEWKKKELLQKNEIDMEKGFLNIIKYLSH